MEKKKLLKSDRQKQTDAMWEALKDGFCPYQTMPGYSAYLQGTKEKGLTLTIYDINAGTEDKRVCAPEDIHSVERALVRVYLTMDGRFFDPIDRYFKPCDENAGTKEDDDMPLIADGLPVVNEESIAEHLLDDYQMNSEVCLAEYLANVPVAPGMTYEQAFNTYIRLMKRVEGDRFYTVKEGETIEL